MNDNNTKKVKKRRKNKMFLRELCFSRNGKCDTKLQLIYFKMN